MMRSDSSPWLPTSVPVSSITAIVLASYLIYQYLLYPIFISPLSKLPTAHFTSRILPFWIRYKRQISRESSSIFAAHQREGPVVLLAPNEVSVASLDGLRKIYTGGFERTNWFLEFANYDGTPNLVTLFDSVSHARRKRMLSNIYSKSYLLRSPDFRILSTVLLFERLLPVLKQSSNIKEGVDVFEIGCAVGAEFTSAYEMGIENSIDIVRMGREDVRKKYLKDGKRKLRKLEGKEKAAKALEEQCLEMCKEAEAYLNRSVEEDKKSADKTGNDAISPAVQIPPGRLTTYPVVYAQLRTTIPAKECPATLQEAKHLIASELLDSIEAGREGIGIAITYAMHNLSQQPLLQQALRDELLTLEPPLLYPPSEEQPISATAMRDIDQLSLLGAVIQETLRLNVPSPGPQRRIVPKGGTVIDGFYIPADVTISSSPYTMNRNEDAYPEAEVWKPERWIATEDTISERHLSENNSKETEKGETANKMRRWFWTFGSGGRMCLGSNFSLLILKVVLAAIYTNFETTILDDEGIEQREDIMAYPIGDKLILGFAALNN